MSKYQVSIPEGQKGNFKIERFTVTDGGAHAFNINPHNRGRIIYPGTYTRLMNGNVTVISDTPAEIEDHMEAIDKATGNILINGLGLGVVLNACLMKPSVTHAKVIEMEPDIIDLVAPYYKGLYGNRFEVIHADALEYKPPKGIRYNMVWSDIWNNICTDNWEDMKKLNRKYSKKIADWHKCWYQEEIQKEVRKEKRQLFW